MDDCDALCVVSLDRWVRPEAVEPDVMCLGYRHGYLSEGEVVALASKWMNAGLDQQEAEIELALLLKDELFKVGPLLDKLCGDRDEHARRVWAFAGLSQIRSCWDELSQPWDQVADVLESLDRPAQYSGLIYYEPVPIFRRAPGLAKMRTRLNNVLTTEAKQLGRHG